MQNGGIEYNFEVVSRACGALTSTVSWQNYLRQFNGNQLVKQ